jgi:hypothetical protein
MKLDEYLKCMKVKELWWEDNDLIVIGKDGNLTRYCNAELLSMKTDSSKTTAIETLINPDWVE